MAVVLLAPHVASADTPAAPSNPPIDDTPPIVVLGGSLALPPGTPAYGQTIIDRDRLTSEASGRVENVLEDIAGFSQFRRSDSRSANPSAQGANLRALGGNAASRTLLVLDGVPMADPIFGFMPYSAIVPDRLSAIRVTRGGGSGAFGAGAVAGTIEMVSATRADLPLASGSAFYGSRNAQEVSASLSPDVGTGFLSLSGRWERGDGFDTTPLNQQVAATVPASYRDWNVAMRAVAPVSEDAEIQARALVYRDRRTLRFAGADNRSQGQDASIRFLAHGPWKVDALAYLQARDFASVTKSSTNFRTTLNQSGTPALGYGGKIELRPPVGESHVLRFGVDARGASGTLFEDAYNSALASDPITERRRTSGRQFTTGAFLEDDWTLGRLVLTGGGRVDHWTITGGEYRTQNPAGVLTQDIVYPDRSSWEADGRAGALWHATSILSLRAAAYTGFRLPTLNELYRSFTVVTVRTNANPALRPEHLKGVEGGFDLTPLKGLTLGVTLFHNRLGDAVSNVTIAPNTRLRENVNAIVADGVELSGQAHLGAFDLSAAYSYSRAKVRAPGTSLDGLDPAQSPRQSLSGTLGWRAPGGAQLSTTLRYTGRQYEDDLNIDSLPPATTLDAFARLPIGHGLALIGRAENIFDTTVYTRFVSSPTLSQDLGTPRTLWIGFSAALGR